ncbi:MAG TPA: hypothetical protein PK011_14010 [Marinagarivorans sp.]|nr:hypothetical protein [Marinagarivorans sp.]
MRKLLIACVVVAVALTAFFLPFVPLLVLDVNKVGGWVFVENGVSEDRARLLVYGGEAASKRKWGWVPPVIYLFCNSNTCLSIYGIEQAKANSIQSGLFSLIVISGRGMSAEIVAHELSHAVIYRKSGFMRRIMLPVWLEEGVATYLSEDKRFLGYSLIVGRDEAKRSAVELSSIPEREWDHISSVDPFYTYGRASGVAAYCTRRDQGFIAKLIDVVNDREKIFLLLDQCLE